MAKVYDIVPFFNELDLLEIRLNELDPVVDKFIVAESHETFGGGSKPYHLDENLVRFQKFSKKIVHVKIPYLLPKMGKTLRDANADVQQVRQVGREREAYARDVILKCFFNAVHPQPTDYVIVSDCDEIPSADAVLRAKAAISQSAFNAVRFKQYSFYYNVNTLIDYGRDICSRARMGTFAQLETMGVYNFRMLGNKVEEFPVIEDGGWHFSYFGGDITRLKTKVNAVNPFLKEYTLPKTDKDILNTILDRRDIHQRAAAFSQLPEQFSEIKYPNASGITLPDFLVKHPERFEHFYADFLRKKYRGLL